MGALTYDAQVPSTIPAKRMFKAFIVDGDNLLPKVLPQAIKSIEILHGNGGPGTIKQVNFTEGSVKHRIDGIEEEKLTYTYNIIEGDVLADVIESVSYHVQVVPTPEGGCIMKNTCTYKLKGEPHVAEEHIKARKEAAIGMFKAVEAYLHANPNEYN